MKELLHLERLLRPITPEVFFSRYWERGPLHISGRGADFYPQLFSLRELDTYVFASRGAGLVVKPPPGEPGRMEEVGFERISELYLRFEQGCSIILNAAHEHWAPFASLKSALEAELAARVRVNVYISPPGVSAFQAHFDLHDTFIFQLQGSKEWTVYAPQVELPLSPEVLVGSQVFEQLPGVDLSAARAKLDRSALGTPTLKVILREGDFLYIPRGHPHQARSLDQTSIHATAGAHVTTWLDILQTALAWSAFDHLELRRGVPPALAQSGGAGAAVREMLLARLAALAGGVEIDRAMKTAAAKLESARSAAPDGHFESIARLSAVDGASRLRRRSGWVCTAEKDAEYAHLYFGKSVIRGPLSLFSTFEYLSRHEETALAAWPGELDEESRVLLARRLIREGLLALV